MAVFAPLSPRLEALAQALADSLDVEAECPHLDTVERRSNYGDGSARYDFWTVECRDCGAELGEPED